MAQLRTLYMQAESQTFPPPDPTSFDKNQCTLIIIEIGFCRDFGCVEKL